MIKAENIEKKYHLRHGAKMALQNINFQLHRGEKLGVLGQNGSGKSTLIRLLAGVEAPTRGKITREMSVSWPLAFGGAFQGSLSGLDNIKFVSRIYQVDIEKSRSYVADFSELGKALHQPVKTYSSGMLARLAFALSLAVDFDCLLIDEVIAVGDRRFQQKCRDEILVRRADKALILVSHSMDIVREYCSRAAVMHNGHLLHTSSVEQAYFIFNEKLGLSS